MNGNGRINITFKTPMAAVGADFPGAMTIDVYDVPGGQLLYTSSNFGSAGTGFFGGVTGDTPFTYVVLRDWADDYVYIDNLYFGPGICAKDADGDGSNVCLDCNDADASIHPGAPESVGDGVDQNCDGKETCYLDADGDGYRPDSTSTVTSSDTDCADAGEATASAPTGDCNDASSAIKPGATETCNGLDDNCDGKIDEGVNSTYYADADKDGYGDSSKPVQACTAPTGYVSNSADCDDTKASVFPGATELCNGLDDDCDGQIDEGVRSTFYADIDHDGYGDPGSSTQACSAPTGYVSGAGDCDDHDASSHPGAAEVCDGHDNNCDGAIDEGVKSIFYADQDQDGYGNPGSSTQACSAPAGYVADNTDCDDTRSTVHPGANEACNGLDDNCNGSIDEGVKVIYYADVDRDGYGNPGSSTQACAAPGGYVADNTDCDDTNGAVHPGSNESCNGIDDNCNGSIDEGVKSTFYADQDGDHYGNPAASQQACSAPTGYVPDPGAPAQLDCDDTQASIHPGALETCNGIDDDCDTQIDEGVTTTFYLDGDADGYGRSDTSQAGSTVQACARPTGFVTTHDDCNDGDSSIHPGAAEVCDGIDQDCDGQIDEGVQSTFHRDADGDGYGAAQDTTDSCTAPEGYVADGSDCDDSSAAVNPGQVEQASQCDDGIDQDCNGQDLSCSVADQDGDGYSPVQGDCDDADPQANPGTAEVCDGKDNDCNGQIDDLDQDADGVDACAGGDCDDADPVVYPGAVEACDGKDNDCNGAVDDRDIDQDGEIDAACAGVGGSAPLDCNDQDANINHSASEVCDGVDNDCDGVVDDVDQDGDGYQSASCGSGAPGQLDCNDADASIHPGAEEVEDGVDNDCDGVVDGGEASPTPEVSPTPAGDDDATQGGDDDATQGGDDDTASPTPTPGGDDDTASPTPGGGTPGGGEASPTPGSDDGSSGCDCSTSGSSSDGSGVSAGGAGGRPGLSGGTAVLFLAALALQRRRGRRT